MLLNPGFRQVSVSRGATTAVAKSAHEIEVPLVGINITIEQNEIWDVAACQANLELSAPGYPAQGTGMLRLIPGAGFTTVDVDASLTVSVPLVGRRIEAKAAEEFALIIADIERRARVWLAT
jgi:hypothetical protein